MIEEYKQGFIAGAVVMLFFWLCLEVIYHFIKRARHSEKKND